MSQDSSKTKNYIIAGLFVTCIVLFLTRGCGNSNGDVDVEVLTPADTSFTQADIPTTTDPDTIYRDKWYQKLVPEYIDANVDTNGIIAGYLDTISVNDIIDKIGEERLIRIFDDYFAVKYYSDTIKGENDYEAIINDSITMNKIKHRTFLLKNLREDRLITQNNRTRKVLGGAFIGDKSDRFDFGGALGYMDKKNRLFQYSYGILGETHRFTFMGTISFGNWKKKPKNVETE